MNLLKKATNAIFFAVIISSAFQLNAQTAAVSSKKIPELKLQKPVLFQEWFAGINVGGTGVNIFIPKFDANRNIQVDSVYFRNMKGKLVSKDTMYSAVLKNDSPYYAANPSNEKTNPFNLTPNECVIMYKENNIPKYIKIATIVEKAGTYYENGPPNIYEKSSSTIIATVED